MSDASLSDTEKVEQARRIDRLCSEFEAAWRMGQPPCIEDYLSRASESDRSELLHELIPLDVDYRAQRGENLSARDYAQRFGNINFDRVNRALATPKSTHSARGSSTPLKSILCPHCRHSIQVAGPVCDELVCPGCGSSFRVQDTRLTLTFGDGRRLGKFELLNRVGVGAFGEVWRARDMELDRIVALKIPYPSLLSSIEYRERFFREARAAAQLRHPNIVTVHEVTTLDDMPAIVSQFVHGVPLKDLLETRRLSFRETAALVADMAEALDYAHRMGLVHRDIKPANVMIELAENETRHPALRPMLVDFGLALREEAEIAMTMDGQIIGTPAYMSPEQAAGRGHRVDARSDVYSLGVVFYELLCNELPFRGSKLMLIHQVLHEEPRAPRRVNDKIPRDLETICLKALAKPPEQRYETAQAMAGDLRRWLAGEPIRARPVSAAERSFRWAKRRPATAALFAFVFLAATVGLPAVTWLWQRAENSRQAEATAKDHLQLSFYFSSIALANSERAAMNVGRAEELLDGCPPRLRGWEYHYLRRARFSAPLALDKNGAGIYHAAFSPNGQKLVTTYYDQSFKVWDVSTGRELHTQRVSENLGRAIFSPNGRFLATQSWQGDTVENATSGTVRLWDTETGQETLSIPSVFGLAFDAHGRFATGASDAVAAIWDSHTGRRIRTVGPPGIAARLLSFATAGQLVAVTEDGAVFVWNTDDGRELRSFRAHQTGRFAQFSHDGSMLALANDNDLYRVWDTSTGTKLLDLPPPTAPVYSTAFDQRNRWFALGHYDGGVKIFDLATGNEAFVVDGQTSPVLALAFSPDCTRLASASGAAAIKLWDTQSGSVAITLTGHADRCRDVDFSPDGRLLATSSLDGTVRIWDATPLDEKPAPEGFVIQAHRAPVQCVKFSPDGRLIASTSEDGAVVICDAQIGKSLVNLNAHSQYCRQVAFSPDGVKIATASLDRTVKLWDTESGTLLQTMVRSMGINCVAFSPDGDTVAAGEIEGTVVLWDSVNGAERAKLHGATYAWSVPFSHGGARVASTSENGTVTVWDVSTGQQVLEFRPHKLIVFSLTVTADGRRFLSGSIDGTVKLSDVETGRELVAMSTGGEYVFSVASSPDGRFVAAGCFGGNVHIWDAQEGGDPLLTLPGHLGIVWGLDFSPDGTRLAAGSGYRSKGEIRIWNSDLWKNRRRANAAQRNEE